MDQSDPVARTVFRTLAYAIHEEQYKASVELKPGARVQNYEITAEIASGGMSRVYSARHVYLMQTVALKTVFEAANREQAERFLREAQALATLNGPGVVRVLDAGVQDGLPFIITELLQGDMLSDVIRRGGILSTERTIDLLEQMGGVLARQERHRLLHRDIKPRNIHVRSNGNFCLFDYGLSGYDEVRRADANSSRQQSDATVVLTQAGDIVGTPGYMAPEQFAGAPLDIRTDLFGLGMTAWECVVGRPARKHSDKLRLTRSTIGSVLPVREAAPHVPAGLGAIIDTLTATAPRDRYSSAEELLGDLNRLRSSEDVVGSVRGSIFVAIPFSRRFDPVFDCVRRAAAAARLLARRVDRIIYVDNIWGQIVQEIEHSHLVVADFTCHGFVRKQPNPNVLTEAAHARAVGKPLVLLSRDVPGLMPFDWRHVPVIRYGSTVAELAQLENELTAKIRHCMRHDDQPD